MTRIEIPTPQHTRPPRRFSRSLTPSLLTLVTVSARLFPAGWQLLRGCWYHATVVAMTLSSLCMTRPYEADENIFHQRPAWPLLTFHPPYSRIFHNLSSPRQFNIYPTIIAIIRYHRQPLSSGYLPQLSSLTRNDARPYSRSIQVETLLGMSARRDSSYDIRGDHRGKAPRLGLFGICLQRMATRSGEGKLSPVEVQGGLPRLF